MKAAADVTTGAIFGLSVLSIFAASALAQQPAQEDAVFRTGVALVRVDAQVVDGRRIVAGLTKDDFRVLDEGQLRPIDYFGREAEPVWIVLLLDVSGSMHKKLDEMAAVARKALRTLGPEDRVCVMFFGRLTHIAQDFTANPDEAAAVIGEGRRNKQVGAGTNINPSVIEAARHLREKAGQQGRRRAAIVILSDNEGLNYQVSDEQTLSALYEADAVLNAIVTPDAKSPGQIKAGVYTNPDFTPADVFKLARETGGEVLKAERAGETFQEMMQRIRLRYSLHYRAPEDGKSGSSRKIKVELAPETRKRLPKAEVRARTGYRLP